MVGSSIVLVTGKVRNVILEILWVNLPVEDNLVEKVEGESNILKDLKIQNQ